MLVKLSLGPRCVRSLVDLLTQHKGLKQLRMADCRFVGSSNLADDSDGGMRSAEDWQPRKHGQNPADFLDSMSELPVHLEQLALISMQLTDEHLGALAELLATNPKLVDLDISWNRFTASGLLNFLPALEEENRLKSVNLSWNSLAAPKEGADLQPSEPARSPGAKKGKKAAPKVTDLADPTRILDSYLKRSNRLQHIDLSNTSLAERAVHYVIKRLAKSLTIQSVHFSGVHDAISSRTRAFIQETLDPIDLRGRSGNVPHARESRYATSAPYPKYTVKSE